MEEETLFVFEPKKKRSPALLFFFGGLFVFCMLVLFLFVPARAFPAEKFFTISKGDTLQDVAANLETNGFVRSKTVFSILFVLVGSDRSVLPGEYLFSHRIGVLPLALRVAHHDFGIESIRITFPEGMTLFEMSAVLSAKIPSFDANTFLALTKGKEGYLFPDTYFIFPTTSVKDIVSLMEDNFQKAITTLTDAIRASGRREKDIVIMASLVEKEASGDDDRGIIAGILWKRISLGMPLQVDAPFAYLLGKSSAELTLDDLKTDSPYNLYTHTGLPPTPIGNPGLASLTAAAQPVDSPYLFYLHDASGTIHYARTFEEHKANKEQYLH